MAEKKKMSVAEILAAARKADSAKSSDASTPPASEAAPETTDGNGESAAAESAPPAKKPAPKKDGARPSVAEMLAAARAEKQGEAAAAKPATPPAKKEAPPAKLAAAAAKSAPKPAPAAPSNGPKDTSSILAAARSASKPGPISKAEAALKAPVDKAQPTKPAKPRVAVPPMPVKPEYAKPKPPKVETEDRRSFLTGVLLGSFLGIGYTSLATTFGLWTLGTARFMFPNVLTEPPSKFKVGFPSSFVPGQVETKFIPQYGVWIVNYEYNGKPEIYALRSVCTHLGCTPNWLEAEQKFKCPCHGSGFYKDGINFEGPAPRPLERYAIRIADDGQLEVDKSKLFQEEIGQWNDPASYVSV
jgi:cytochrome b6-f complex iron-sulfur subunit